VRLKSRCLIAATQIPGINFIEIPYGNKREETCMRASLAVVRAVILAALLTGLLAVLEPFVADALYRLELSRKPPPDTLPVPVDDVRATALRDTWHAARGRGRRHEGIDIFAARGTPVRATTEGVVARIGENRLGGRVVWITGPGRQRHYYAHLDRVADIQVGQRIAPGTVVGYVGNTGNARRTPPHLHYGIYTREGAINPFPLLTAESASDTKKLNRNKAPA
jgi:murein DD-endopeptidase MepM/ murein hydrolase activator NlpD